MRRLSPDRASRDRPCAGCGETIPADTIHRTSSAGTHYCIECARQETQEPASEPTQQMETLHQQYEKLNNVHLGRWPNFNRPMKLI